MASSDFNCAICFDTASDPVVTRCGHLFCWACLDHWLSRPSAVLECPVCKGRTDPAQAGDIIPLYGKGRRSAEDTRPKAPTEAAASGAEQPQKHDIPASGAAFSADGMEGTHHERPHAPRAPTPPRPRHNPLRGRNPFGFGEQGAFGGGTRWHFSNIGFPIMLFGVDTVMTPIILLAAILYCAYRFLPWREWRHTLETRLRQRGQQHDPAQPAQPAPQGLGTGTGAEVQPPLPPPSASMVAQIQWEYCGVIMFVLGLVLLVVY